MNQAGVEEGSGTKSHKLLEKIKKCPMQLPMFIVLPSSCCCGVVKVATASRFFCVLRLIISIILVAISLEGLISFDAEKIVEQIFRNNEFPELTQNISSKYDEEEFEILKANFHRKFSSTYYSSTSIVMVFGIIEIVLCSLQIHGARKKLHNFIRPYVIWTGVLMTLISIVLLLFISLLISKPHIIGLILTLITAGFLSVCVTDFIYGLANLKQMRAMIGLDHVRLSEI